MQTTTPNVKQVQSTSPKTPEIASNMELVPSTSSNPQDMVIPMEASVNPPGIAASTIDPVPATNLTVSEMDSE